MASFSIFFLRILKFAFCYLAWQNTYAIPCVQKNAIAQMRLTMMSRLFLNLSQSNLCLSSMNFSLSKVISYAANIEIEHLAKLAKGCFKPSSEHSAS